MTFALIPAGGKSTRMGRPKLALELGGRTVLERVIAAFRDAGVERVLVVISPHLPDLAPLAHAAGAVPLILDHDTPDMRATAEQGLAWAERVWIRGPDDPWLLAPADHPTLDSGVVRLLLEAYRADSGHTIFIPTYREKRGHPCVMAWHHVTRIRTLAPELGINSYLRQHRAETREVPVASPDVLVDLDTPEDYERLLERWG